ncbi:site-specific integrase [bacterium]|nr:site-specific integrase [bacterium]
MKRATCVHSSSFPLSRATAAKHARCISISACIRITDPQRPLFVSQKRGHFSANTMCQLFLDIYKAVGLKDASSHSGRRTYITRLANKGVGVRLLAELAGHSHISTTQRYIDVNSEQLSAAVELL